MSTQDRIETKYPKRERQGGRGTVLQEVEGFLGPELKKEICELILEKLRSIVGVHDYDAAIDVAASGGTANHDYTVEAGVTFLFDQVMFSGTDDAKVDVLIGDGAVSETFPTTIATIVISAGTPKEPRIKFAKAVKVIGTEFTTTIRLVKTNLDNQVQDLYSTIIGETL